MRFVYLLCIVNLLFISCQNDIAQKDFTIGVFGGSQCSLPAGNPIKKKWEKIFNANVVVCGVGGAGFGLWQENNVLKQLKSNQVFDVYILWCSTNDHIQIIESDSEDNKNSQAGGLSLCLDYISQVNPNAKVLLFTSLWVPHTGFKTLPQLVDSQIAFCVKNNIPYLNQYDPNLLVENDFFEDMVHFGTDAYWKIEKRQTDFLYTHLIDKKNGNKR